MKCGNAYGRALNMMYITTVCGGGLSCFTASHSTGLTMVTDLLGFPCKKRIFEAVLGE